MRKGRGKKRRQTDRRVAGVCGQSFTHSSSFFFSSTDLPFPVLARALADWTQIKHVTH